MLPRTCDALLERNQWTVQLFVVFHGIPGDETSAMGGRGGGVLDEPSLHQSVAAASTQQLQNLIIGPYVRSKPEAVQHPDHQVRDC